MKTIYLVVVVESWESDVPLLAFADKEKADAFCEACTKYTATRPPRWIDTPRHDEDEEEQRNVWETWALKDDEWRSKHPAAHLGLEDLVAVDFRADAHTFEVHTLSFEE